MFVVFVEFDGLECQFRELRFEGWWEFAFLCPVFCFWFFVSGEG